METSKLPVRELLKPERQADTEVRKVIYPAITREHFRREGRERRTIAIDKEFHQDHYQTRVLPVLDRRILPEKHEHQVQPTEYKEFHHKKEADVAQWVEKEKSQFKPTSDVLPALHTVESTNTVVVEHHHHHVYETIQPVIEREIIETIIIHTTIPIHELIEKDPSFHPKTVQPRITLAEYLAASGTLEGGKETRDFFEGEPKVIENGGANVPFTTLVKGPGSPASSPVSPREGDVYTNARTKEKRIPPPQRPPSPVPQQERIGSEVPRAEGMPTGLPAVTESK